MEQNQMDGPVTNGLLVVELVGGQRKLGDAPTDNASIVPAGEAVAGDPVETNPAAPTYGTFFRVATLNDPTMNRAADRTGQPVAATLSGSGEVGERPELVTQYADETRIAHFVAATGHNIPAVFWEFLHLTGPVLVDGQMVDDRLIDWLVAMGYPISEPYWVRTRVAGVERDVLVQLFERRVLTFTPSNLPGYQVEMGNVGQHYFRWRYPELGYPWAIAPPQTLPVFFAGRRDGTAWQIYSLSPHGGLVGPYAPAATGETVPFSLHRAYGYAPWLLVDSRRGNGLDRQLYGLLTAGVPSLVTRLTYSDGIPFPASGLVPPFPRQPVDDYNPAVSPDGTKLVFVSTRAGRPQLYIMGYQAGERPVSSTPVRLLADACAHEAPSWSPDGRRLVWMARCDGQSRILRGDLTLTEDRIGLGRYTERQVEAHLVAIRALTDGAAEAVLPRWSPDGTTIVFASKQGGQFAVYQMMADGTQVRRLTEAGLGGDELAPSWSPDGAEVVFSAQRAGRWRLEVVSRHGGGQRPLTGPDLEAHWPVWAQ
jgi:hypothetical protein